MEPNLEPTGEGVGMLRRLEPRWNEGMIIASIAISLVGAFTSTQLWVLISY